MKRLFLVSLLVISLVSCSSIKVVEDDSSSSLYYSSLLQEKESVETRYNYIYYLYMEEDYESVISQVDKAVEKYPKYSRFYKIKALSCEKLEDKENYSSTLASIIELEPYDEELRNLYLDSLLAIGEKEKAVEFSKETIILFPENGKAISLLSEESEFYLYLDSFNKEEEETTPGIEENTEESVESGIEKDVEAPASPSELIESGQSQV